MQYTQDRYNVAGQAIGGNVWRSGNHQFAGASHPTRATDFRVRCQSFGLFPDLIMHAVGGAHVVGGNVHHQFGQIGASQRVPFDPHALLFAVTIRSMMARVSSMTTSCGMPGRTSSKASFTLARNQRSCLRDSRRLWTNSRMNSRTSWEAGRWVASASAMKASRKSASSLTVKTASFGITPKVMTITIPRQYRS